MRVLTTRRSVALLTIALGLLAVAAAAQTWLTGSTSDTGLGASAVAATGSEVAAGFVGLVLVVVAGVIAATVTGGRMRALAAVLALLAALGATGLAGWVVADPAGRLGPRAAAAVGRTGSLEVSAHVSPWGWVGLLAASGLVVVTALGLLGIRAWPAPTSRYDAPVGRAEEGSRAGARGERVGTEWDRLSAGEDPTDVPEGPAT